MGFSKVESFPKYYLKHASITMAITRARLHPFCGHMNGGLSVVDDFGIKYFGKEHVNHLIK